MTRLKGFHFGLVIGCGLSVAFGFAIGHWTSQLHSAETPSSLDAASLATQANMEEAARAVEIGNIAKAAVLYRDACRLGHVQACDKLLHEVNFVEDFGEIREKFAHACDIGNVKGCYYLGNLERFEQGKEDHASSLFRRACDSGELDACVDLAYDEQTHGHIIDAAKILEKACDGGSPKGCYELAFLEKKNFKFTYQIAGLFEKACNAGYVRACARGMLDSPDTFRSLLENLCDRGNNSACYEVLEGAPSALFKERITHRCEIGDTRICVILALWNQMLPTGDMVEALRLASKACDGGNPRGCYVQGMIMAKGDAASRIESWHFYRKACLAGDLAGCWPPTK